MDTLTLEKVGGLTFAVEKMFILPDCGSLAAFVDVAVNDIMIIKGVRLIARKKGLFVSMPQEQGKDSRFYDQVVFRSAAAYEAISAAVLEYYETHK